jgi:hypothetical protein
VILFRYKNWSRWLLKFIPSCAFQSKPSLLNMSRFIAVVKSKLIKTFIFKLISWIF